MPRPTTATWPSTGSSKASAFAARRASSRRTGSRASGRRCASSRSCAANGLLEDDQHVALVDRLALLAEDLLDLALVLGLDGHLHLHRLEDDDRVAFGDVVAHGTLDLPDRARDVGLDVRHCAPPPPGSCGA